MKEPIYTMPDEIKRCFANWERDHPKTERIAFRCDRPTRLLIEEVRKETGMNISQTMEFILACFFTEVDKDRKQQAANKADAARAGDRL